MTEILFYSALVMCLAPVPIYEVPHTSEIAVTFSLVHIYRIRGYLQ